MKAVFLDRDGTLIVDPPDERVDGVDEIELFPDTIEALELLATLDYSVFIITNQAGIAEGRLTTAEFENINQQVLGLFKPSGLKILKTYMCPHSAADNCDCRKPKPALILKAAKDFNIDLKRSWTIGDHASDIQAGLAAGTKTIIVQTANKPETSKTATFVAPSLLVAIKFIASH